METENGFTRRGRARNDAQDVPLVLNGTPRFENMADSTGLWSGIAKIDGNDRELGRRKIINPLQHKETREDYERVEKEDQMQEKEAVQFGEREEALERSLWTVVQDYNPRLIKDS